MSPVTIEATARREVTEAGRSMAPASMAEGHRDGAGTGAHRSPKRSEGEGRPGGLCPPGRRDVPSTYEVALGHSALRQLQETGAGERPSGRGRAGSVELQLRTLRSIECKTVSHAFDHASRSCTRSFRCHSGLQQPLRQAVQRRALHSPSSSRHCCSRAERCSIAGHILLGVGTTITTSCCIAGLDTRRGPPVSFTRGSPQPFEVFDV